MCRHFTRKTMLTIAPVDPGYQNCQDTNQSFDLRIYKGLKSVTLFTSHTNAAIEVLTLMYETDK